MIDLIIETITSSLPVRRDQLSASTPLRKIVRDSIDAVELIAILDDRYQVQITPADLDDIRTLGDVARYVELHLGEASEADPLETF